VTLRPLAATDAEALAAAAAESREPFGASPSPSSGRTGSWAPPASSRSSAGERNTASRRAIERLGARFEGVRRADMPGQDGSVRHSAYYSIVQAEWPAVRRTLEAALAR
jgi:hypothetical protein